MKKVYVIEVIGYGKNQVFALKEKLSNSMLNASLKVSKRLEFVFQYAQENKIEVEKVGTLYEVLA